MGEKKKNHKPLGLRPDELAKVAVLATNIDKMCKESGLNETALRHVFNLVAREVVIVGNA
jgi:hypothetical protein